LTGGEAVTTAGGLPGGGNLPGGGVTTPVNGPAGEGVAGGRGGLTTRASAYPAASGRAQRPTSTTLTTLLAPLDREVAIVSRRVLGEGEPSWAYL